MRAWVSVTGRLNHGLEDRVEDVNAHGGADSVFQDGLVVFAVELVARLKMLKENQKLLLIQMINIYSGRRLMGSLLDREKLIPITD